MEIPTVLILNFRCWLHRLVKGPIVTVIIATLLSLPVFGQIKAISGRPISPVEMDSFIQKQMTELGMPGLSLAIINNNEIVYHRALGVTNLDTRKPVNDETIFEAASLSKPVFAWLVMRMKDKGFINLDTPLYRYLPYTDIERDNRYKLITARLVLSHQSGFPNWRYFEKPDSSLHIPYGQLWLKFEPGTRFAYSGEGYHYLAKVIAHLTGSDLTTLNEVFEREEAQPLGMKHAWYSGNPYINAHKATGHTNGKVHDKKWPTSFPTQDSSTFGAAGGLHIDALSYARFLMGLIEGKVLTKESLTEMLHAQVQVPHDNDAYTLAGDTAWSLGFAIKPTPYGTLYEHGGNNGDFQSGFILDLQRKTGYVFFTNCDKGAAFNKKLSQFMITGQP